MAIRNGEPADYPYLIQRVNDWWGGREVRQMLPKLFFIHFRPTTFVWEEEGRIAGFIAAFMSQTFADRAYAHFVGVDPEFRRTGIGRALYRHLFSVAGARGGASVHAVTSPSNLDSLAFHRRLGFRFEPGTADNNGIPATENYDGLGSARVLMTRLLGEGDDHERR